MFHTAGVGAYADSFIKMIEDGRLRSPLGVYLVETEKEQSIAKFLKLDECRTKEEAMGKLRKITDLYDTWGSYVDSMAIHFTTQKVDDACYGAERGNEIFIAYPSAHIASQYYFSGQLNSSGGGYWNDQWVWANEERGMDLNAGLIFIPEKAMVDRKTGSRYELNENREPIINSEYQEAILRVVQSPDFDDFKNGVWEITGRLSQDINSPYLSYKNQELISQLDPFRQQLEQEFRITDRRLQNVILNNVNKTLNLNKTYSNVESIVNETLQENGILYQETRDPITSKEFWESYFANNPTKKPSKVVYYRDQDPTRALYEWQSTNGLQKKSKDEDLGFSERHIERHSQQATAGLDRFKSLAIKVIDDYYR